MTLVLVIYCIWILYYMQTSTLYGKSTNIMIHIVLNLYIINKYKWSFVLFLVLLSTPSLLQYFHCITFVLYSITILYCLYNNGYNGIVIVTKVILVLLFAIKKINKQIKKQTFFIFTIFPDINIKKTNVKMTLFVMEKRRKN